MISVLMIFLALAIPVHPLHAQDDTRDGEYILHSFEKIQLSSTFYAEGAAIGDVNQNGHPDVICGPYWYEGPEFRQRNAFYKPVEFDPLEYSDHFIAAVEDVNEDGRNDILIVGFPGQEAVWYEHPGNEDGGGYWQRRLIFSGVDNESPGFVDLDDDGRLELLFHTDGVLGYAARDPSEPSAPWTFHPVSEHEGWETYNHGLGFGDITGNGYKDILMKEGWWENPGPENNHTPWQHHAVDFGSGGAQMHVYDIDGDGFSDVVTSLEAHGWGLSWFRQVRTDGEIDFEENLIMGDSHEDNPYGVRFSQPHAVTVADLDNNGTQDVVAGKRWWAHGPDGDPEPNAPAVLYWFKPDRKDSGEVEFIPYLIDDDSGAGTQIATGDLTGNGYPDIATCNKKGAFVFLNRPETVSRGEWEAAQPERIMD